MRLNRSFLLLRVILVSFQTEYQPIVIFDGSSHKQVGRHYAYLTRVSSSESLPCSKASTNAHLINVKATRSHLVREIFEIVLFLFRWKLKEMLQFIALQDSKFNEALIQNMKHEALFCQRLYQCSFRGWHCSLPYTLRLRLQVRAGMNARLPLQHVHRRTTFCRWGSALLLDNHTVHRWATRPGTGARGLGLPLRRILQASAHLEPALYGCSLEAFFWA